MEQESVLKQQYPEPVLYCVIRTDIPDMNPGKAAAQAMHAQAAFDTYVNTYGIDAYDQWKEDRSFGTTLTVLGDFATIQEIASMTFYHGVVTDPTYPIRNYYGEVFTREEATCMWVFLTPSCSNQLWEFMKKLPLMP